VLFESDDNVWFEGFKDGGIDGRAPVIGCIKIDADVADM
jgi:hypothetical protein